MRTVHFSLRSEPSGAHRRRRVVQARVQGLLQQGDAADRERQGDLRWRGGGIHLSCAGKIFFTAEESTGARSSCGGGGARLRYGRPHTSVSVGVDQHGGCCPVNCRGGQRGAAGVAGEGRQ